MVLYEKALFRLLEDSTKKEQVLMFRSKGSQQPNHIPAIVTQTTMVMVRPFGI